MIRCTCGGRFVTIKTGGRFDTDNAHYSCDTLECPQCHKQILDVADQPFAIIEGVKSK